MATTATLPHRSGEPIPGYIYTPEELEALTGIDGRAAEARARTAPELPVAIPDDVSSLADLERRERMSSSERQAELELALTEQRKDLIAIAALRAGRLGTRKKSEYGELYEVRLANYNKNFTELTKLKHPDMQLDGTEDDATKQQKTAAAIKHYLDHLQELREDTTDALQSTRIGRIVTFFNKGGFLRKFVKYAGIGLAAGALGALTGGIAGGVAAGVAIGGARFIRGAMRAEGDRTVGEGVGFRGKRTKADRDQAAFDQQFDLDANGHASLADAGAAAMAEVFSGDIKDQQSARRRSLGWGAVSVVMAPAVGYLASAAWDKIGFGMPKADAVPVPPSTSHEGVLANGSAAHANIADRESMTAFNTQFDQFIYKVHENPFFQFDQKAGAYDMGPALQPSPEDAGKPAGWHDLTQRWMNSPEQFASMCTALGIEGLPDDAQTINGLAETLKVHPVGYQEKFNAVMDIMKDQSTTIERVPIGTTAISSEFGKDMGGGNMDRFWQDRVVNQPQGDKFVIKFKDPVTGIFRVVELRCDCGGQRMVEIPDPVYEAPAPQGGGYVESQPQARVYPQGGGSPAPQETPQGGGEPVQPSRPNIPTTPIPVPQGGGEPVPERPALKTGNWAGGGDGTQDAGIGELLKMGAGALTGILNVEQQGSGGASSTKPLGVESGNAANNPAATAPKLEIPGGGKVEAPSLGGSTTVDNPF